MGKSWQKVLFFGNMIFTTFFIVKEIPPTSGDFYDKICIRNFWKKFQLKTSQIFKGIYDSMPPLLSREKFHQLQPFECCLSGLSQIFKNLDLEKIQSVPGCDHLLSFVTNVTNVTHPILWLLKKCDMCPSKKCDMCDICHTIRVWSSTYLY